MRVFIALTNHPVRFFLGELSIDRKLREFPYLNVFFKTRLIVKAGIHSQLLSCKTFSPVL